MTTDKLDRATVTLIEILAQAPTQQLVILITQHASLPSHTSRALRTLADQAVLQCTPLRGKSEEVVKKLADTLRRLIDRGDPSQARRLVPSQASLVDLALCVDAHDILARLMDKVGVDELLKAGVQAFERACKGDDDPLNESKPSVIRAAYILARLIYCLPRYNLQQTLSLTSRRAATNVKSVLDARECARLLGMVNGVYCKLSKKGQVDSNISKICLIDLTWGLIERYSATHMQITAQEVDKMLHATALKESTDQASVLSSATLAYDVNLTRPLIALLEDKAPTCASLQSLRALSQNKKRNDVQRSTLRTVYGEIRNVSEEKEAATASERISGAGLPLDLVYSILPYWQNHSDLLATKLNAPPYIGQSDEMIVQMLMDEGETAITQSQATPEKTEYEKALEVLNRRANVFNDTPLDVAAALPKKGKGRQKEDEEISSDLKAFILSRAEEPDSDEEGREEWDPFAGNAAVEIGFEEELDDVRDPTTVKTVARGDGDSDTDYEKESEGAAAQEDGEGDGATEGVGHSASGRLTELPTVSTSVASDKAAERILIAAWKEKGETLFAKDARKTASRTALLANLANNVGTDTKRWDDQLVESWGTMFSRNPRKEKLLARVDDYLRTGNPNHMSRPGKQDEQQERTFGPDRGRGGRVLGGGGRGGQRGRGSGNRGGRGRGGSNRGGNKTRG